MLSPGAKCAFCGSSTFEEIKDSKGEKVGGCLVWILTGPTGWLFYPIVEWLAMPYLRRNYIALLPLSASCTKSPHDSLAMPE